MPPACAGIKAVLLPRHNEKDLVDIPPEVKADLTLRLVDTLSDVVPYLFEIPSSVRQRRAASVLPQEKAPRRLNLAKLPNGRKDSPRV